MLHDKLKQSASNIDIITAINNQRDIIEQMLNQYATGTITPKGLVIDYQGQAFVVKKEDLDSIPPTTGVVTKPPVVVDPYTSIEDLSKVMIAENTEAEVVIQVPSGSSFGLSLRGNSKRGQYDKYLTFQKTEGKKLFAKAEKAPQKRVEETVDTFTGFSAYLTFNKLFIVASTGSEELIRIERPKGIDIIFKDIVLTSGVTVKGKGVSIWQ